MSALTGIILDLNMEMDEAEWWRGSRLFAAMLASLQRRGLWLDFKYVGKHGAPLDRFSSIDEVIAASTSWEDRIYVLHTHGEGGLERAFEGSHVSFSLGGYCRVILNVASPALEERRATLLDGLVHFICDVHDALGASGRISHTASVRQEALDYPKMRPRRLGEQPFHLGYLVNAYDPSYFAANPRQGPEQLAKLLGAPLPAGCTRLEHNGLVVFQWARDFADDAEIVNGCARQERFFVEVLQPPILPNFNEAGDMRMVGLRTRLDEHPPLTVYDANDQIGYKTILAEEDGRVDGREWARFAGWARARQLPDGTALKALRLIVPFRSAAIALHERAVADGIDCVLYPENGKWWNPFPPGLWQD